MSWRYFPARLNSSFGFNSCNRTWTSFPFPTRRTPLPLPLPLPNLCYRATTTMASKLVPQLPNTPPASWPEPQNWPAEKIRRTFIDYFTQQPGLEHTFWPSSGVIPFDDDTLLFANAVSSLPISHTFSFGVPTVRREYGNWELGGVDPS